MIGVERIEGLSVHFAVGVAIGALLSMSIADRFFSAFIVSVLLFLFLGITVTFCRKNIHLILIAYTFAGILCFQTAEIRECYESGTMDPITYAATSSATYVKGVIDEIPFEKEETSGMIKALVTGDRSGVSRNTRDIFRKSGASHILALSGMHLGILYMLLMWAGSILGNSPAAKRARCISIIIITGLFSIATGSSPSIIRAFLFISINEILKLLGRKKNPGSVFCIALFVQLSLNPLIIRSVGFQLSYMAMCGITLIYPVMESWYPGNTDKKHKPALAEKVDIPRRIWQAAALSISCQIFTAPVSWYYFRSFPTYFLLTNLLALPLTSLIMVLSVGTVTLSAMGICPDFMVMANEKAVSILIQTLTVISEM